MVPGRSAARVVIHPGRLTTLLEVHAATHPARAERRQHACSDPDGDECGRVCRTQPRRSSRLWTRKARRTSSTTSPAPIATRLRLPRPVKGRAGTMPACKAIRDAELRAICTTCASSVLASKSNIGADLRAPCGVRMVWWGFRALKTPEERLHCRRFSVGCKSSANRVHLQCRPDAVQWQARCKT